jgi:hypothetical protein
VSPAEYKTDDPFGEWHAFQVQLDALKIWAKQRGAGDNTNAGTAQWTYDGSVYVDGQGNTVTLDDQFEVVQIKMDYTYRKAYNVATLALAPLVTYTGTIKVVNKGGTPTVADLTNAAAISTDAKVYLTDSGTQYGPLVFNADGSFSIANVPTGAQLSVPGFSQGDGYYAATSSAGAFYQSAVNTVSSNIQYLRTSSTSFSMGTFYLSSKGKLGTVEATTDGILEVSATNRIAKDGKLVLKFSEAIDPYLFALTFTNTYSNGWATNSPQYTWAADDTVEITSAITSYWRYSTNGSIPLATVSPSTVTTAAGVQYYFSPIDIYTEEQIKLVSVELVPSPARALYGTVGDAVDLLFNKPLNVAYPGTTAWIGGAVNGNKVDFSITGSTLRVYIDKSYSSQAIYYSVASATDIRDVTGTQSTDTITTKAAAVVQSITTDKNGTNTGPISWDSSNIIVTFDKDITLVSGTTPKLYYDSGNYATPTATGTVSLGNRIKFPITNLLAPSGTYKIEFEVEANGIKTIAKGSSALTVTVGSAPTGLTWADFANAKSLAGLITNDLVQNRGNDAFYLEINGATVINSLYGKTFDAYVYSPVFGQGVLTAKTSGSVTLARGANQALTSSFAGAIYFSDLPGAPYHADADGIRFVVTTVDDDGYLLAAQTTPIHFVPDLISLTYSGITRTPTTTSSTGTQPIVQTFSWVKQDGVTYTAIRQNLVVDPYTGSETLSGLANMTIFAVPAVVGVPGERVSFVDNPVIRNGYRYTITATNTGASTSKVVTYDLVSAPYAPTVTASLTYNASPAQVYAIGYSVTSISGGYSGDIVTQLYRAPATSLGLNTANVETAAWALVGTAWTLGDVGMHYDVLTNANVGNYYVYRAVLRSGNATGPILASIIDGTPGTTLTARRPSVASAQTFTASASNEGTPAPATPRAQYVLYGSVSLVNGAILYLDGVPLTGTWVQATGTVTASATLAGVPANNYYLVIAGATLKGAGAGSHTISTKDATGSLVTKVTFTVAANNAITGLTGWND